MSDDLVNQLTINFLISKQQLQKLNKKVKETSCERKIRESEQYSDRIKTLFNDLLVSKPPEDLLFEVKVAFDTFIEKSIYYFKAHDNNEELEIERNNYSEVIYDDIDFEKEEREIEKGNYIEYSTNPKVQYESEDDRLVENDKEDNDEADNEDSGEDDSEELENNLHQSNNPTINHTPIIVTNKYNKQPNSIGVDDIQKLPLDWFQSVRQNYKKNQIIPRKKEPTIIEKDFRDLKKKI